MHTSRFHVVNPSIFLRRAAALAIFAGAATLGLRAEQPVAPATEPVVPFASYAATPAPFTLTSVTAPENDLGYSSSTGAAETASAETFLTTGASSAMQPPPRRRYGRPRYSDGSHNPDGSNKYAFEVAGGMTLPTQDTKTVNKQGWAIQVGAGRNFNKNVSVLVQFDWDNMGLQGSNLTNQSNLYFGSNGYGLDGSSHVWSFTVNPSYNFYSSGSTGMYVVGGVGFYHKVTSFTVPATGTYCDYYYGCYSYQANALFDHYTSNALGMNGGLGLTFKPSRFANERFFIEARYVYIFNSQRPGYTTYSSSIPATATNFYPANSQRTSYVPVKVGIRF